MENWKKRIKNALPPTIVTTAIFFLNYFYFGMENTIIAPFMTLTFIRLSKKEAIIKCYLKTVLIYLLLGVFSYMALINSVLNILINMCALFWIVYLLIDEYNPNNYFPFGMALIFFQISPVGAGGLPIRLAALTISSLIVLIAAMILHPKREDKQLNELCSIGLLAAGEIFKGVSKKVTDEIEEYKKRLQSVNESLSYTLYIGDKSRFFKREDVHQYLTLINVFQSIIEITEELSSKEALSEDLKLYLQQLSLLLQETHDLWKAKRYETGLKKFEKFADTYHLENEYLAVKLTYILNLLMSAFIQDGEQKRANFQWNYMHYKWYFSRIITKISWDSPRFRFALRMVIVMVPCLFFADRIHWVNAYWLPISVFFMLIPDNKQVGRRVLERVGGTALGICICFVLYTIVPSFQALIVVMCIANFCIYMSQSYWVAVIYITCAALALNTTGPLSVVLGQRLAYTLAGAAIVLVVIRFLLRDKANQEITYYIKQMLYLNGQFVKSLRRVLDGKRDMGCIEEVTVDSYLIISKLNKYCKESRKDDDYLRLKQFIELEIYWLTDMSYIFQALKKTPRDKMINIYVNARIRKCRKRRDEMRTVLEASFPGRKS